MWAVSSTAFAGLGIGLANLVSNSLNRQIIWSTTTVAFVALSVMFFGWTIYFYAWDWLYPNQVSPEGWSPTDFVVLGINVAIGQAVGAYVGWRLAQRLVKPLDAVTQAARAIAEGNFAGRATGEGTFGEVDRMIADFNRMAEELQRAEAELKYSNSAIAHELRTPLTVLRGRIQGLADGVFEPNRETFLGLVKHVDSLTRIVEDLRTLSLMNAGRLELRVSNFDLAEEIEDVVASTKPAIAAQKIDVTLELANVMVNADRARLRQAALALIDNAIRYAPGQSLVIALDAVPGFARLTIADKGPGMTRSERDKAFERFWRADDARTRKSGGSGLGLSVVKAIAEAHGGAASIEDCEVGTTIMISIPRE